MSRKPKRDLTMEEQLARGPVDLPFLMLTLILLGIGLIVVFSASYATAYYDPDVSSPLFYFQRQALFAGAGLVVMYLVSKINYQTLRILSLPMLVVSVALLALALTPLGVEINQVKRWLRIFIVAGPTYQPSEIAKVTVILFFAARLSKRDTEKHKKYTNRTLTGRTLNRLDRIGFLELVPYGAVLVIVLLLVVLEPHMSGTILIMVGAASVLFAAGIHLGWFVGLGSLAVAGTGLHHPCHRLYDPDSQAVAEPVGLPPGWRLSDHPVPVRHRVRRPAGQGAGQKPARSSTFSPSRRTT